MRQASDMKVVCVSCEILERELMQFNTFTATGHQSPFLIR
jgi:hypothetical protein